MGIQRILVTDMYKAYKGLLNIKPFEIHGINPTLKYLPTGKSFELPRFSSVEMKQAVAMNRIAVSQTKFPVVKSVYPKASPEDLKLLTSNTIENSYARAVWINPKNGKVYNILKTGETNDGKILVRILDEEGEFVKEASLTPKTIAIPDDFTTPSPVMGISHGELVTTYARRANPFANYKTFNVSKADIANSQDLVGVNRYLDEGGKIDYLSCSYSAAPVSCKSKIKDTNDIFIDKSYEKMRYHDRVADRGVRVFVASGNYNPKAYLGVQKEDLSNNLLTLNRKVEGVGSLNPKTGKISDFSISSNSELTQHYEVGEFQPIITKEGLNITGLSGTDMPFPNKNLEKLSKNPFLGQSVERVQGIVKEIKSRICGVQTQISKLFGKGLSISEISAARAKLEAEKSILEFRQRKIFDSICNLTIKDGKYQVKLEPITGTSFSAPIRAAKVALNDMMEGFI